MKPAEPTALWHSLSLQEVADRLETNPERGLGSAEAARRLQQFGPNVFTKTTHRSTLAILLDQFRSLIVVLLLAATVVAFVMGETVEGIAILVVILLNALIGFLTEWRAGQALAALQKQSVPAAHVVRDGEEMQLPAADLVPGDLVVLTAGSRVPADGRVTEAVRLQIEEAPLTGESKAVSKHADPLPDPEVVLAERRNMAFLGTTITEGRGLMLVTATGMKTEMGKIGTLLEQTDTQRTPLERKLAQLGRVLLGIVLALSTVIVLAGWLRGNGLLFMLEIGIALAIAAVPEGLPAVATMTLALGMQRMARLKALIRKLPAVETLGSTTVICTDKTGTLTRNEMTVQALHLDDRSIEVTGVGYRAEGEFRSRDQRHAPQSDDHLLLALRIGALCNDAHLETEGPNVTVLGDPTEGALLVAAAKAGLTEEQLANEYPRVSEIPFSSETKRMVTVHKQPGGGLIACVKGAPGTLLETSQSRLTGDGIKPMTDDDQKQIQAENEKLASRALRVLALAYREIGDAHDERQLTRDLIFVGLVGMIDPLREEARQAIALCREAGIRTILITGDQQATAAEIGRQLGLDRDPHGKPLRTVHGRELRGLDQAGWQRVAAESGVFARVSPEHKLRIVEALQSGGEIVAMTGDGVNDAPALKKADIGVAMGVKGTDVAKEAADMVITDDNFATIVVAIEQGRIIYANILRFIHYLFSCNFSEILTVFAAIMLGWPLPLAALQVLWLNMITDVFPALALALEPSAQDVMNRPPRDPRQPLITPAFLGLIAWQGVLLAVLTLLAFYLGLQWYGWEGTGQQHAVTMAFMTLALAQIVHAFNARSQRRSAFTARLFTNGWLWGAVLVCVGLQVLAVYWPPLQKVLHTVPLAGIDWMVVGGLSVTMLLVVELVKLIQRGFQPSK